MTKKLFLLLVVFLLVTTSFVIGEDEPEEEKEAGSVGPENRLLSGFDRVADNIGLFLARIGGAETYANAVRRVVAERRAEHLRILRLKADGEITAQEFAKMNTGLQKHIEKSEAELIRAKQRNQSVAEEKAAKAKAKQE